MRCPACNAQAPRGATVCGACNHRLTAAPLGPGQVVASRYEILSPLGRGGMGMVFKARDRMLEETVAIKVLRSDVIETPAVAQRFRSEIKLARAVSHKNVCRIHEYGEDHGMRYISMAYVEGVDLKQVLRTRGPLLPAEGFDVAIQVADGLQAIHDEGIIHRDLKTPNLMLDRRGVVRLMDFGIAKQWEEGTAAGLTAVGQIVGTPEYMSPEQVRSEKLDARSDIYALGIVIFELFSGDTPFHAETPVATIMKQLHDPPPLQGPGAPVLPPALVPVLRKALAKNRNDRYASARELADALRQACAETPGALLASAPHPMAASAGSALATPTPFAITPVPPTTSHTEAGSDVWPEPAPAGAPASRLLTVAEQAVAQPQRSRGLLLALLVGFAVAGGGSLVLALLLASWFRQPTPPPPSSLAAVIPATSIPATVSTQPAATPAPVTLPPATTQPAPVTLPPATTQPAAPLPASTLRVPAPPPSPVREARMTPIVPPPTTLPMLPLGTVPAAPRTPAPRASAALEIEGYLAEAESAFAARKYDAALRFYEQVLRLDPANTRASVGRDLCQRSLAQTPVAVAPSRSFVPGQTASALPAAVASGPRGFGDSGSAEVRRVDQAGALPAKIAFEVEPATLRAGDPYEVRVLLVNESAAALQIRDLSVSSTLNGRTSGGSVPALVGELQPRQKAVVYVLRDRWDAEARSWALAVLVRTTRGDALRNELAWK